MNLLSKTKITKIIRELRGLLEVNGNYAEYSDADVHIEIENYDTESNFHVAFFDDPETEDPTVEKEETFEGDCHLASLFQSLATVLTEQKAFLHTYVYRNKNCKDYMVIQSYSRPQARKQLVAYGLEPKKWNWIGTDDGGLDAIADNETSE